MSTVAGIFNSSAEAESAVAALRTAGIGEDRISLLTPGTSGQQLDEVPTTETEQPGMGKAVGGAVGGALGAAGGLAAASLLVPGIGPVLAAGIVGAALLGVGGAAVGMAAGGALEDSMADEGLPHDELFVYEDALRRGRSVVLVVADDEVSEGIARDLFREVGAESIDAAREAWWVGLRDAEEAEYTVEGGDFGADEPVYRHGFEASLHPRARGRAYDEDAERLRECFGAECKETAFQRGYERGRRYQNELVERHKG